MQGFSRRRQTSSVTVFFVLDFLLFVMMIFMSEGLGLSAKMQLAIIFICLAGTASAAPVSMKKKKR